MSPAVTTYLYMRESQQLRPIDACTDAAQLHNLTVPALAAVLIALDIDVVRLSLI
jgi:hypothetical protein